MRRTTKAVPLSALGLRLARPNCWNVCTRLFCIFPATVSGSTDYSTGTLIHRKSIEAAYRYSYLWSTMVGRTVAQRGAEPGAIPAGGQTGLRFLWLSTVDADVAPVRGSGERPSRCWHHEAKCNVAGSELHWKPPRLHCADASTDAGRSRRRLLCCYDCNPPSTNEAVPSPSTARKARRR
ncbi:hypothetical protein PR003_g10816 [Phytophthora rubi]|uniref:Uncharacterized protein n=1 Tax=Phytophthora rubi TaxID=129364 RepID=A0A6A3HJ29_9STRA|nr:hypothetical protein PR001_g27528 [Phytophthora rubi]KAE8971002.1 hypothetical protein PR002_g26953 [Phytophthora rubi]KAE9339834.1 hypothetical protein PR003_g10816 [Phytophthora rubi]